MIIGTAGHIDHGKTSLVRALTGVDTDRLKEEKARGISIELGFAYTPAPDGRILGFVDVPGHERFVHTMVAGAAGVDFILFVIAADDGVMPQTREHMAIIDLLGLTRGVIALTKIDAVDAARLAHVRTEIEAFAAGSPLADAPVLPVSSVTGIGLDALRQEVFTAAAAAHERGGAGGFRFAVDRSFTIAGAGTIVTGIVLSGEVETGARAVISPSGQAVRVRSIHAQNRSAARGTAGERCALNLSGDGVSKDSVSRGDFVVAAGLHAPSTRIDATCRLLASAPRPASSWMPVRLHFGACETAARIVPLSAPQLGPGEDGFIQIVTDHPVAAAVGDRFVLRDTTGQQTIGGGVFLDLRAPARRRRAPERLAVLNALRTGDAATALTRLLDLPPYYVDLDTFVRDRALGGATGDRLVQHLKLETLGDSSGRVVLTASRSQQLVADVRAKLTSFHAAMPDQAGMGAEALRRSLAMRLPAGAFRALLQKLSAESIVSLDAASVRLLSHRSRLAADDERQWALITPLLSGDNRFRPPRASEIAQTLGLRETDVRRILKALARLREVDEIAPDHFFLRASVAEMAAIASDVAGEGEFGAAQFRDRLDNGRKVAIQILEFFDRQGLTVRRGDMRRINPRKLGMFEVAGAGSS